MKPAGIDDIAKHLSTLALDFTRNPPTVAAPAPSAVSASSSSTASSYHQTLNRKIIIGHGKEKENTPPRVARLALSNHELDVPVLKLSKTSNSAPMQERKVRRWKLKHRTSVDGQQPNEQPTRAAVQSESLSSSPLPTAVSWANFLSPGVLLKTPSPPPPPSSTANRPYLQSPPKHSKKSLFDENISIDMPKLLCLTPDEKTICRGIGFPQPRRPMLKLRRRPIGRPSPLQKRVRRED